MLNARELVLDLKYDLSKDRGVDIYSEDVIHIALNLLNRVKDLSKEELDQLIKNIEQE